MSKIYCLKNFESVSDVCFSIYSLFGLFGGFYQTSRIPMKRQGHVPENENFFDSFVLMVRCGHPVGGVTATFCFRYLPFATCLLKMRWPLALLRRGSCRLNSKSWVPIMEFPNRWPRK